MEWRKRGDVGNEVQRFRCGGGISPGDLKYSLVTLANDTVLYTWNVLREYILVVLTKKKITMWDDGYVHCCWLVAKLCLTLVTPWTIACQAPLSLEYYRQEYWSGLPFPSPGDLPDPQSSNLYLLHLQVVSLPLSHQGSLDMLITLW